MADGSQDATYFAVAKASMDVSGDSRPTTRLFGFSWSLSLQDGEGTNQGLYGLTRQVDPASCGHVHVAVPKPKKH